QTSTSYVPLTSGCPVLLRTRLNPSTAANTTTPTTSPTTAFPSISTTKPPAPPGDRSTTTPCSHGIPCTKIPPPTRNIAAVPSTVSPFISHGAAARIQPPTIDCTLPAFWHSHSPKSSSFTIPATSPYTNAVIPSAIATSAIACCANGASEITPSESTMISADRMKSV